MEDQLLQPPRGMIDWTPDKYYMLLNIASRFARVAESYGYRAIETPAVENFEVLKAKAGEDVVNEIYYFRDKAGRELGLRFDMTVPVARVLSYRRDFPRPVRLYYISKVWRYDEPQFGRFREFHQFGVEHVGSSSIMSDAEVLALSVRALETVGLSEFEVKVSDRRIMDHVLGKLGISSNRAQVLRILDKRGKVPDDELTRMLTELGVDKKSAELLIGMVNESMPFDKAPGFLSEMGVDQGLVKYIEDLANAVSQYGILNRVVMDLGIVRGLDYYTGFVFELYTSKIKLAVGGGGRYDELLKIYSGEDIPAVGFAIGIERVMLAMGEGQDMQPKIDYYIYPFSGLEGAAIRLAESLRASGFRVIVDVNKPSLRSALEYASKIGVRKFIIIGKRELEKGVVRVRDLETWSEEDVDVNRLAKL